ncbi:RDD family protein [Kitasatospora terrestris]|uniref:RDD domain-containing protein n=1 Tax=Kitasatospora terrestris TaxID=258051 RepID=A0ABP9DL19_9ACTN
MSTYDPSGTEPEEGGKPPFDKQPPPQAPQAPSAGSPYDTPPGYGAPYGAPPGGAGSPYGAGAPQGSPPPPGQPHGAPYGAPGAGPVPGMPPLGSWPNRILARVIDFVLVEVVAVLVLLPFVNYGRQDGWVGATWLGYGLYLVYEGIMLSRDGQTVGKKVMKVRVAMLVDGSSPTPGAAWTRAATFIVPALICCGALWWPIDGLFGVFDKPYRQCIHDKAAKTVVVTTA